jgi:hypothetical protein
LNGRQQQRDQNTDDGNDHQQFDQGKTPCILRVFRLRHGFHLFFKVYFFPALPRGTLAG